MSDKNDGKFVVVQGGQRVSGDLHDTQQEALTEAAKVKKKLAEGHGQNAPAQPPVEVKQNLYG